MGLQPVGSPDPLHRGLADALDLGHGTGAPMGHPWGHALRRGLHKLFHPVGRLGHRSTPSGGGLGEGAGATLLEPPSPQERGGATDTRLLSDPAVGQAIGGQKDELGSEGHTLRSTLSTDPGFESAARVWGNGSANAGFHMPQAY